ncbi:MAG: hypothetical protein IT580_04430 [Verrucomicrobiales bacterium]|nr:hypothetical protein [Verrucomicrobiales bacterium]
MTDFFALLDEPRRPWIEPDTLKDRFLRLSAELHPDRFHDAPPETREAAGRRYTDLNSAYQALRDTRARSLHLLELESGNRPKDIQRIPPGTMDLFTAIGQACRDVDGFLQERAAVTSPMLKVRLFQRGMEWVESLKTLQQQVHQRGRLLEDELRAMNAAWESAPPAGTPDRAATLPLDRLADTYRGLSYVARWTGQIQERMVQLAAP